MAAIARARPHGGVQDDEVVAHCRPSYERPMCSLRSELTTFAQPSSACSWRRTASRSHSTSCSPELRTLMRRPSSAATTSRRSSFGRCRRRVLDHPLAERAQPVRPTRGAPRARLGEPSSSIWSRYSATATSRSVGDLLEQPVGRAPPPTPPGRSRCRRGGRRSRRCARPRAPPSSAGPPRGCRPSWRSATWSRTARRRLGGDAAVRDGGDALARGDVHRRGDDRLADPSGRLGAGAGFSWHEELPDYRVRAYLNYQYDRTRIAVRGDPDPDNTTLVLRSRRRRRAAVHDRRQGGRAVEPRAGATRPTRRPRGLRRPRFAAAAQAVPQIQPQPGGIRREYWIQAETRELADHADAPRRVAQPADLGPQPVHRVRLPPDDARVRRLRDLAAEHPRTDAGGARSATCSSCTSATPTRKLDQAVTDAPARGQVQPRVRRRLHGRVHARGRLHRARASRSPTSGSARPSRSASGRTTTTAPTTR